MKAEEARQLALKACSPDDQKELDHIHDLIKDQAKVGFFDVRLEHEVNSRIRDKLRSEGYTVYIGGDYEDRWSYTHISWKQS
jgi:hypothetical protein